MTPSKAIAKREAESVEPARQFHGKCTPTSWEPDSKTMSYLRWEEAGRMLGAIGAALQWYIADWLRYGEDRYGEKFVQALDGTRRDPKTLLTWLRVARAVTPDRRREELTFSHHVVVSALDPEAQAYWLAKAIEGDVKPNGEREGWSSHRLKAEIGTAGQEPDVEIDIEVVDKTLVPLDYLVPDIKAIRNVWKAGTREIDGLKLTVKGGAA